MQFRKYISEDSVYLDMDFDCMNDVLTFLSKKFASKTGVEQDKIHELLKKREEISSTWIGHGTILPHNHDDLINDLHMIFIRCKNPLLLADGNKVTYIVSILTSRSQDNLYLSILQGIGKLIKEQSEEIDKCASSLDLFHLITASSYLMGVPFMASDLAKEWPRINKNDTLATALDLMKKHSVYFLPVFTEDGLKLCGVLDLVDLLKAGFPDYVFSLSDFSLIQDFQPVKYFWENENNLHVEDYIRDHRPYVVRIDASYPEIFFSMIKGNRRHLLVMGLQDQLVGVIHPNQIINKMLRP